MYGTANIAPKHNPNTALIIAHTTQLSIFLNLYTISENKGHITRYVHHHKPNPHVIAVRNTYTKQASVPSLPRFFVNMTISSVTTSMLGSADNATCEAYSNAPSRAIRVICISFRFFNSRF